MKYIKITMLLAAVLFLGSCSSDDPSGESIFPSVTTEGSDFDQWLKKNYTEPYNIKFLYRYNDNETNNYNVIPADRDKAKALAILVKHVWLDAYSEAVNEDFVKTYSPRTYQLIGSAEYNTNGSMILGTAEGGVKITLFRVNAIDIDNPIIDLTSPVPNTGATPIDLNYWFFHTMHHEFCHILTQTKNYSTEFQTVSVGKYQTTNWINVEDKNAPAMGFVSGYASSEYNEDFAEIYSTYVTHTDSAWNALLDMGKVVKKDDNGETIYEQDSKGNPVYKTDAKGNPILATDKNGWLIPATDENGDVIYQKDSKGNYIYITSPKNGKKIPIYSKQGTIYYYEDGDSIVPVWYYNKNYYSLTTKFKGDTYVAQTDADGNPVYDAEGYEVPEYYRLPVFEYERMPVYDTTGYDAIVAKFNILYDYFKNTWGIDLNKVREVVLRRSKEAVQMDLRTLK